MILINKSILYYNCVIITDTDGLVGLDGLLLIGIAYNLTSATSEDHTNSTLSPDSTDKR
jgi:hypothetical protein